MCNIALDLSRHCIETEIKRRHNRTMSVYFKGKGQNSELEKDLIIMEEAMRRFDFSALRSIYSELAGGSPARVILSDQGGGIPGISIDGCFVDLGPCLREE